MSVEAWGQPKPTTGSRGWLQAGVEIYGGPLLNSWLDRELGLASRLALAAHARAGRGRILRRVRHAPAATVSGMPQDPMISALGAVIRLDTEALTPEDREALHRVWTDAAAAPSSEADDVVPFSGGQEIEHLLSTASQKVTRAAIKARRGELWMLHAGAVADEQGRVVVVIGPSGRGKTTATRTLAQRYGYVSDETVAIDSDGIVHPYRKPLSIIEDEQRVKAQRPPSELGLGALPAVPLRLAALVLLDRRPDGPDKAVIEDCNVGDVLDEVVQQTSHFADLPHPLRTLAAHAEAVGGFRRAIYREAEALADAFAPLFRDPATNVIAEEHVALAPPSRSGAAEGWQRTPHLDALALTDPSRIAIVQSGEAGGLLRLIDGIGPVLWQHADGRPLAELVSAVVAAHGEPGSDDAAQLVDAAIAELAEQGLLTSAAETGFDPTETRYQAGAS